MPRFLRKLKILEVSGADRGAGKGCRIVLMKRDSPRDENMTHTEHQPVAKRMADRAEVLRKADPTLRSFESAVAKIASSRDPADQELWAAYKNAPITPAAVPEPAQVQKSEAMLKLEKKARKLAKREGISQAAAFAKVYADPKYADLVVAEKSAHFAKAAAPPFMPQVPNPTQIREPERSSESSTIQALRAIARAIQLEYPARRYTDEMALRIAAQTPKGAALLRAHRDPELSRLLGHAA